MPFNDLQEFFDPNLRLPIGGKEYVVPSPDAKTGLWFQRMLVTATAATSGAEISEEDLAALELDDGQEQELYKRALGTAWDEMAADKVPWTMVKHAGTTAFMWIAGNRAAAEEFWNSPPGEAQRPSAPSSSPAKKKTSARPASRASSNPKARTKKATDSRTSS